jgi:hypothetical protein
MTGSNGADSTFFSWTLFHDISPAIKDLYDRKQESLFAEFAENSHIETRSLKSATTDGPFQMMKLPSETSTEEHSGIDPESYHREPWKYWSSGYVRTPGEMQEFASVSSLQRPRFESLRGHAALSVLSQHPLVSI